MLLAIDIGNTNLKLGLFQQNRLLAHWNLSTNLEKMPDEYGMQIIALLNHVHCEIKEIEGVSIASVVAPLTDRVAEACHDYLDVEPLLLNVGMKTGVTVLYDSPQSVGMDRISDAVAVSQLYGGPACIIDFGTATTFNALTVNNEYLGGAITAGIGLAAEALYQHTSKLTRVDLHTPPSAIGRNTIHAMQSGLLFGYVGLVEGMVARFRRELGAEMKVIATGGLAGTLAHETTVIQTINPFLTLEGIRLIWEMNRP